MNTSIELISEKKKVKEGNVIYKLCSMQQIKHKAFVVH